MAKVYKRGNAALFDIPIESIQNRMAQYVPWLDTIFGKCEKVTVKDREGRSVTFPAWYDEKKDYIKVMPDDRVLKNMAFFLIDDPVRLLESGKYSVGFSAIVWGDMRRVTSERNLEVVKAQLLKAVRVANPTIGSVRVNEVYENCDSVWRGFTVGETDSQFMMQPYFAVRINGTLYLNEVCR